MKRRSASVCGGRFSAVQFARLQHAGILARRSGLNRGRGLGGEGAERGRQRRPLAAISRRVVAGLAGGRPVRHQGRLGRHPFRLLEARHPGHSAPAIDLAGGAGGTGPVRPRRNGLEHHPAGDRDGFQPVGGGAVAQLAEGVQPPAVRLPVPVQRAGVHAARAYGGEAMVAAHLGRCRPALLGAVAQGAVVVVAPAIGVSPGGYAAGAVAPGGDHVEPPPAHGLARLCRPHGARAVAQLSEVVGTPAGGPAIGGQRAGVVDPGGDGFELRVRRHPNRRPARVARRLAQLARAVEPPAVCLAVVGQRAGVAGAARHRSEGHLAGSCDRFGAVGGGSVAQLAVSVSAPAMDGPAGRHAAAVAVPHRHRSEGQPAGHRRRLAAVVGAAIAQLPVGVGAPAAHRTALPERAGVAEPDRYRSRAGLARRGLADEGEGGRSQIQHEERRENTQV